MGVFDRQRSTVRLTVRPSVRRRFAAPVLTAQLTAHLLAGWFVLGLSLGMLSSQTLATAPAPPPLSTPFPAAEIPLRQAIAALLQTETPSQAHLRQAITKLAGLQQTALATQVPGGTSASRPQAVTELDPTAAIIYPIVLPDRLAVIAAIPDQPLAYHAIAQPQAQVMATLRQFRQSLHPVYPNALRLQASQQIYDWLLRPLEPALTQAQIQTLVFTLDSPLRDLPMAALHDGHHYLIERYGIALAPSLTLLPATPLANLAPVTLLAVGLSEARQGFPALPAVEAELAAITTLLPAHTLVNAEFTEIALAAALQDWPAPIVHIASHAQVGSSPEATFILTWDDQLRAANFSKFLNANVRRSTTIELLILSACQTASGEQWAALGLAGLAIRSGVRSVVATLWAVNDRSTADLMACFYRGLVHQQLSRANALRQAQLSLLYGDAYEHPYYWAPFILAGDWR
ncbi:CHAT domain-containing protein [Trichothermofontia sichuanensis B231]|uniref:CHAT domain-containing protein n=1 Tax=Trichothermofontia sichuanensis TaxID=3045816 RepID=UPI0022468D3F|nr:CHAT domain-containing protein [Trichothermofontia sichuanensis]UZQ54175.1 CHAT domain-containing protein [Trichothermofontia sichuanensis B231]